MVIFGVGLFYFLFFWFSICFLTGGNPIRY